MREILFRAKGESENEWTYGYPVWMPAQQCYCMISADNEANTCDELEEYASYVDGSTLGQCTGLVDSKGTKIFEGDIVKATYSVLVRDPSTGAFMCEHHILGVLTFSELGLSITDKAGKFHYLLELFDDADSALEVVGNIHDNPDLLEVTA